MSIRSSAFTSRPCQVHGETKDYFCVARECMSDLCQQCLQFHEEFHIEQRTNPHMLRLNEILRMAKEKVGRMIWTYQAEVKKLERGKSMREQEWDLSFSEIKANLAKARKVVESVLDHYFTEMQDQLMKQYLYPAKKTAMNQIETPLQQLKFKVEKLEIAEKNLDKDRSEEMIKYIFSKEDNFNGEALAQKVENVLMRDARMAPDPSNIRMVYDRETLPQLYAALQNFVSVDVNVKDLINESAAQQFSQWDDASDTPMKRARSQRSMRSEVRGEVGSSPVTSQIGRRFEPDNKITSARSDFISPPQSFSSPLPPSSTYPVSSPLPSPSPIITQNSLATFDIKAEETFLPDPVSSLLPFFEAKTKNFYFVDLSEAQPHFLQAADRGTPFNTRFTMVELDIPFSIPRHHRSLITQEGYIYLTGGLEEAPGQNVSVFAACYLLVYESRSLQPIANMNYPRAAHSLLQIPEGLLVVGGISTDCGMTDTCEIFNFEQGRWRTIGNLIEPTMNAALCLFNGTHVLKLGGKIMENALCSNIECLDLTTGKWSNVSLPPRAQKLPASACAIQVNSKQVLLFGGTFENFSEKSDRIFVLEFDNPRSIKSIKESSLRLPMEEGYWNQQVFVLRNMIVSMQNISNPANQASIFMNNRKIVGITSNKVLSFN